jgi:O-methyltransferase involved in polyketide biosynthesis
MPANKLTGVQWTLFKPLLSRAWITHKYKNLINDPKAIEIVTRISGPMPEITDIRSLFSDLGNAARARTLDDAIKTFIQSHPCATIVNLGAGFDTSFSRIDNGSLQWLDVDLPEVIGMRKLLIPEADRSRCIPCSLFDTGWMREISSDRQGLFMVAGGVMPYFTRQQVQSILSAIADNFPDSELMFDAVSWLGRFFSNRINNKAGIDAARMRWTAGKRLDIGKWDTRIVVIDHFPLFARIERSADFDREVVRLMDRCDKKWRMSMFHLKFSSCQ